MPFTIHSRLLLLVLSLLLPGMLAATWLIGRTFDAERDANVRTLRETTRALSTVIDGELGQRATVAHMLAQSRLLDTAPRISDADLKAFAQQAGLALQGLDGWVELHAADRKLLDTRQATGLPVPATRQASVMPAPVQAASQPADDFVQLPMVRPLRAGVDGEPAHARLVQPVQRDGRTVLNLLVTLPAAELQRIVDAQRLPPDWRAAVVDSRGTVVAHHLDGPSLVGLKVPPDVAAQFAQRNEGMFDSVAFDDLLITVYFRTGGTGWTFLTAMPREPYTGLLPSPVRQTVLGGLGLLALALVSAAWVSRGISAPVHALAAAAAQIRAGGPVTATATGLAECDAVAAAMADAATTLQNGRAELERQVAEAVARTRQAEQHMAQTQRLEALGRLTGAVAHDFNNLLGVISNSAHLIQRKTDEPALKAPVAATLRAVEVGKRLTGHLLRFADHRALQPQPVDLAVHLPALQPLLSTVLGAQIQVSVRVAPGTRPVVIDSSELELAIVNVAVNARDAMPCGGELRLRASNATAEDCVGLPPLDHVLIAVSDDGCGMAGDVAARAFEPFFTTKPINGGTGLGLSQVHGFCVQAGGTARLASTPGLGTTVSILLPASSVGSDARRPAAPRAPADTLDGVHVLLVEDNASLEEITTTLLRSYGATVDRASDAADALRRLATSASCDVVLADVVMPGTPDGLGLVRQLRQLRRERPTLPVVLVSGCSTDQESLSDFFVLRKPYTPEVLLAALQQALSARRGPTSP